jgi:prevent-host-death family protein
MATTVSSREFNQHASEMKKASEKGPVFITHRGQPAHVLLTIDEYNRMVGNQPTLADLLAMPEGTEYIEFDPPRMRGDIFRPVDLS